MKAVEGGAQGFPKLLIFCILNCELEYIIPKSQGKNNCGVYTAEFLLNAFRVEREHWGHTS